MGGIDNGGDGLSGPGDGESGGGLCMALFVSLSAAAFSGKAAGVAWQASVLLPMPVSWQQHDRHVTA